MKYYEPKCPECDLTLDFDGDCEMDYEGDFIIAKVAGHCLFCKKRYTWEDVYKLNHFQNLQEG